MDALITKDGVETRLSSIGLLVTDFQDSSPSVTTNKREVTNRSGYIFSGAVHKEKRIVVSGTFVVPNAYALEEKKDEINGLSVMMSLFILPSYCLLLACMILNCLVKKQVI